MKSYFLRLWSTQRALCVVWWGVVVYTVFFTVISFLRYDAFSYSDFDFAIFTHECWKILHGSGKISLFNNVPIWGNALELISVVISPVFLLSGFNPKSLLFLQSFFLGAGAVPIFLIARRKLPESLAVCLAISYLFYPPIWYANLYEYNLLVYSTFTLLMAFWFFQTERFGLFLFFIFLSLINRVDLGVVTFMFGAYAFSLKRPWKWVLWPAILSFLWVVAGLLIIIPRYKGMLNYDSNYSQFGNGFGQVIQNIVLHPQILWKLLATKENVKYLLEILWPVCFFPLLGLKEFLICALSMIQHLISARPQEHTIYYHYTSTITPFVYISAIYGMSRFLKGRRASGPFCVLLIVLSVVSNYLYGPISEHRYYTAKLLSDEEDVYKKEMLKKIPGNAPVVSTFEFSPMLAARNDYYSFHYIYWGYFRRGVPYQVPENIQYAFINFEDRRMRSWKNQNSDLNMRSFLENGNFGVIDYINNVALFRKNFVTDQKLFGINQLDPSHDDGGFLQAGDGLKLQQIDIHEDRKYGHTFLRMALYWHLLEPNEEEIKMVIWLRDENGQDVFSYSSKICYGMYPPFRWGKEEEIVDNHRMLLPDGLAQGKYQIFMALYSLADGRIIPVQRIDGNVLVGTPSSNIMITAFDKR